MRCLKFTTGELLWEDRALGPASMCYADNRLYLHGENGDVAPVEPSSEGYRPGAALPLPTSRRMPRGQMGKILGLPCRRKRTPLHPRPRCPLVLRRRGKMIQERPLGHIREYH